MKFFLLGLLLGLCGCAALGLAGGAAEILNTAQDFASAKVAEAEGRAQFFTAGAAGIAALVPIAARWVDHRMKARSSSKRA